MIPYDKTGAPIQVGDYIAYGHALGRCAGLRIGKVLAIKSDTHENPWRHVEETDWKITVWGVEDDWIYPGSNNVPVLCRSKGTLQFPQRMIKLETVPAAYHQLLKDVTLDFKIPKRIY